MVAHQQGCALVRDALKVTVLHAVHRMAEQPDQEAHGEFRHDPEDVGIDQNVEQRHHQEQLRDGQVGQAQQHHGEDGRDHHEQGIEYVVGSDHPGALVLGSTRLDQRIQRHDVEAAEHTKAHDRQQDPPRLVHAQQRQPVVWRCANRHVAGMPPPEQAEHGQAERAERHQADLHLAPAQPLAQQ